MKPQKISNTKAQLWTDQLLKIVLALVAAGVVFYLIRLVMNAVENLPG